MVITSFVPLLTAVFFFWHLLLNRFWSVEYSTHRHPLSPSPFSMNCVFIFSILLSIPFPSFLPSSLPSFLPSSAIHSLTHPIHFPFPSFLVNSTPPSLPSPRSLSVSHALSSSAFESPLLSYLFPILDSESKHPMATSRARISPHVAEVASRARGGETSRRVGEEDRDYEADYSWKAENPGFGGGDSFDRLEINGHLRLLLETRTIRGEAISHNVDH